MGNVSGWTEAIILSLVFVTILGLVVANFNALYNKTYTLPFTDNSGAKQLFVNYHDTAKTQIEGGEAQFDAQQGITLKSSWGLAKDAVSISWAFLSGGWIEQTVAAWNLGEAGTTLAVGLRIIYFLSLVFALLFALFKVAL
jgi:hypothetical protein